ncbi:M1 family metallopeptidase [Fulvivirga sp. M361]|uniref:M1 family metallopeptidase n=1 Tax=Fulvivirga sp. M361 TaxID=2594266 RepID=UPI001179A4EA|nr:M1 family metallopeptidase [Fulvivirga sp. M361]
MYTLKKLCLFFLVAFVSCETATKDNVEQKEIMTFTDKHTYAQPDESVVTHLDWTAAIDFESKTISAKAILTLSNSDDASKLMLDTKALSISEVLVDGDQIQFSLRAEEEHKGSALEIPITPQTRQVTVHYSTSPGAEALQWLSPQQTADKEKPFLFTQSQAILARSWVPIQDSPGIRFTYNAKVTVPQGLMALMSAENPQTVSDDGVYNFKMVQPIPAYLLALAVGDLTFTSLGQRSGVYAEASVIERSAAEFEDLESMITAAEELYGPYRWDRYDLLVLPPSFPFGGMENPRLTFATPTILAGDKSLVSLVAHELAHSWSGNLVTNATWDDFWLNEGFTVYFEQRIMEKLYDRDYSEMLAALAAQDLVEEIEAMTEAGNAKDTHLKLDLSMRNPDDGVTSIAYNKGYLLLRNIEETIGREKFDHFLKSYFEKNAFKVMTTEAFIRQFETFLQQESTNFDLNTWIYQSGLPEGIKLPSSNRFSEVDEQLTKYMAGAKPDELNTQQWTSHEWLHFVRSIPETVTNTQLAELDDAFGFTKSGNAEVLTGWLIQVVKHDFSPAYERLEDFLIHTGRRKFLSPIYGEMIKTEQGKIMASTIYKKARPNYHFVATNTLDDMLDQQ